MLDYKSTLLNRIQNAARELAQRPAGNQLPDILSANKVPLLARPVVTDLGKIIESSKTPL